MAKVLEKPVGGTLTGRPKASRPVARTEKPASEWPAEGPHARGGLINEDATPGCGLFSSKASSGGKVDPGAG